MLAMFVCSSTIIIKVLPAYAERVSFFNNQQVAITSVFAHKAASVTFIVSRPVVEDIICSLFFDEKDEPSSERAMSVFKERDDGEFEVTRNKTLVFKLSVSFVSCGVSFRQASRLIEFVREATGVANLAGASELAVRDNIRIICAVSLQALSVLLKNTWAFSIATDSATHQGRAYLDIRVRFVKAGKLYNFHVLAVPLHGPHKSEAMFKLMGQVSSAAQY